MMTTVVNSAVSCSCCGRCCYRGAGAVLTFSFVPLAPSSPSTTSRLWLQKKKHELRQATQNVYFEMQTQAPPTSIGCMRTTFMTQLAGCSCINLSTRYLVFFVALL